MSESQISISFPYVFGISPEHLATHPWQHVHLNDWAGEQIRTAMVQFVAISRKHGCYQALGSGFIVGRRDRVVYILTAAHVLVDAANVIAGSERQYALAHLESTANVFSRRVIPLINDGLINVAVDCGSGPVPCRLLSMEVCIEYKRADIALLSAELPPLPYAPRIRSLPIDMEKIRTNVPVIAAGFSDAEVTPLVVPMTDDFTIQYCPTATARAGFVKEMAERSTQVGSNMLHLSMPIPPGYSGGPVVAVRTLESPYLVLPENAKPALTAIGVLSHDSSSGSLDDESTPGEAYAMPAGATVTSQLRMPNGEWISFSDAIEQGTIDVWGTNVRRAYAVKAEGRSGFNIRVRE